MAKSLSVIIDTDPGIDDAIALLLAWASPELNVLGITTVAGNVELEQSYLNAHRLRWLAGRRTPIYAGCPEPILKPLKVTHTIHGRDGLGISWPEMEAPESSTHSVDFIIEQALNHKNSPVTLCMLGPLTNLAMALILCPEIKEGIKQVVLMGGALDNKGNTSPIAEFNFFTDPHAAARVFDSGLPIVMSPLDVTRQTEVAETWLNAVQSLDTPVCKAVYEMLSVYRSGTGGGLHDPCIVAWLISPELFTAKRCDVKVKVCGDREGQSVPEWKDDGQVLSLINVNADGFLTLLKNRIQAL